MRKILDYFEEILGVLSVAVMVTITFVNVITRYFLSFSLAFTEELALYLFVWATLLGTSLAFKHGTNMAVTLLFSRFKPKTRRALYVFSSVLSVAFFVTIGYWGTVEVIDEFQLNVMTEAMGLPVYLFTLSLPIVSASAVLRIFFRTADDLRTGNI